MGNAMISSDKDGWGLFGDMFKGLIVGAAAGAWAGGAVSEVINFGGFAGGALSGAAGGGLGGFIGGSANAWAEGADFIEGLHSGLICGGIGVITGGIIGGSLAGIDAVRNDTRFWNGKVYESGGSFGSNGQFLEEKIPPGRMPTKTGEIATREANPNYGKYGWTRDGGTRPHFGIDYSGKVGDPVYAMYEGDVIKVGLGKSYGPNAVRTSVTLNSKVYNVDYGHLSNHSVSIGNHVNSGSLIGQMGRSGIPANMPTHVHIAVWRPLASGKMGFVEPSYYLSFYERLTILWRRGF